MTEQYIRMEKICKQFSGVPVLKEVDFELNRGEIHALLGENGAGKSTLMKILTAEYRKDSGSIFVKGEEKHFAGPKDSINAGIAFVHQELGILPTLSVGENIFIGRQPKKQGLIDWKTLHKKSNEILEQLHITDFDSSTNAGRLSVGQLQIVEIAKAMSQNADIFIMDEPTSSLSSEESGRLFSLMKDLTAQGKAFIYISHRLQEVIDICDRLTVLRDGNVIRTVETADVDIAQISEMMIGRKVEEYVSEELEAEERERVLEAKGITCKRASEIDFALHKGEIVCLYGLVGAGRTELARAILDKRLRFSGKVFLYGEDVSGLSYREMLKRIGFLPEERKTQAVFTELPMFHNLTITDMDKVKRKGIINLSVERKETERYIQLMKIKGKFNSLLKSLSGGTQQKVAIAKWLYADNKILILDEPTKGIDIQARYDIYDILGELTKQGVSIVVISSDVEEVMTIAQRIVIMRDGCIVKEMLNDKTITEELILSYAIGSN